MAVRSTDDEIDGALLTCLDSVDELIRLRAALDSELSQGWLDLARAKYMLRPSGVGETLFSLKPHDSLLSVVKQSTGESLIQSFNTSENLHLPRSLSTPYLRSSKSSFERALNILMGISNTQQAVLKSHAEICHELGNQI